MTQPTSATPAKGTRWFAQAAGTRWFTQAAGTRWFTQAAGTRWFTQADAGTRWFTQADAGTRWFTQADAGTRWFSQADAGTRWFSQATPTWASATATPTGTKAGRTTLADVAARINAPESNGGRGVTVALIDTGVAPSPMLDGANIVLGPDFSSEPEFAGRDTNGHGTHLAGIITSLAPEARLLSLRAGETEGKTHPFAVINAINWLVNDAPRHGMAAQVLVLAYCIDASAPEARLVEAAVQRAWDAGITVCVAGGNTGEVGLQAPATNRDIIAIGAEAGTDAFELGDFTTRGDLTRQLDLLAPGRSIVSVRAIGAKADEDNKQGRVGLDLVAGTGSSQACAVAGAAAAVLLATKPLTNAQVKATLVATAEPVAGSAAKMLDLTAAVEAAAGTSLGLVAPAETGTFDAAWSGHSWVGHSWVGHSWVGHSWVGHSWVGHSWVGHSWVGHSWVGHSWVGHSWVGHSWVGHSWVGHSWVGHSWVGHSWVGHSWVGHSWV